jgi:glycosyltransferase involved in cell wall biosynthesis
LPELNWVGTVYHGLPRNLFKFRSEPGAYLAFLGRMSPEKRPDLAIEVARRAGIPLKIAAKVDRTDREYFESVIKPLLSLPGVEFVGEIGESQKEDFLGGALALLFPVDWPEPFGLVMIEALACGTPIVARPCGSVTEVLRNGVTGFVGWSVDDLVGGVRSLSAISRRKCREEFERRFTAEVMVAGYEQIYYRLASVRPRAQNFVLAPRIRSDAALAREAARQWRPVVLKGGVSARAEDGGPAPSDFM